MRFGSLLVVIALLACGYSASAAPTPAQRADLRVMIDISGSMKRTDPHNLRQPATELLVRLLPGQAHAGIWTFGSQVEPLMAYGEVNEQWRERGLERARRIGSTAMHTDIPAALDRVLAGKEPAQAGATSVILLTDGVVDVAGDEAADAAARWRVLEELAPRLRAAGIRVHTVALSDEADHELMAQLSLATDGFFAVADTAEELQKLFVQALDTAAPSEQLPLEDNQFLVDSSIDELTALVFHHGAPMAVFAPDGSRHTGAQHADNFRWFAGAGFELITIANPATGTWRLEADTEAGSRVTIVSNLSLATSRLIQNGFPDQPQRVEAQLREYDRPLQQPELLALVNTGAHVVRLDDDFSWEVPLMAGPEPASYAAELPMLIEPGRYEVTVTADGKTFRRSWVQRVTVRDHLAVQVGKSKSDAAPHRVAVDIVNPAIDRQTSELQLTGADDLAPTRTATGWSLLVPISEQPREIGMTVIARKTDGAVLTLPLDRLRFAGDQLTREPPPVAPAVVAAAEPVAEVIPPAPAPAANETAASEPAEAGGGTNWLLYGMVAGANLLLAGLTWVVIRTVRKGGRKSKPAEAVAADASDNETTSAGSVQAGSAGVAAATPAVATGTSTPDALAALDLADLDLPLDAIDLDPAADQR